MNTPEPDNDFAHHAAEERDRVVKQDALGYAWRGVKLQPWNARRELWFLTLQELLHEGPLGPTLNKIHHLPVVEERIRTFLQKEAQESNQPMEGINTDLAVDWSRFQPDAGLVLWLALNSAEEIHAAPADLPQWLLEIGSWSETQIEADELIPAVRLAFELRTAYKQLITQPRPDTTTKRRDAGN